jgi:nucleoside 2-deoxyribosyltransferase
MRAYIAGPLFNESERWWDEQIDAVAARAGLETFLPHRDGKELNPNPTIEGIFRVNVTNLDGADLVIANLNGVLTDDGTAWEIGYAYARGTAIIGVYTDRRLTFPGQVVNLMLECSVIKMVRSLDELAAFLKDYVN